ncbi:hypothetical protein LTR10_005353 [Elasticomyces elasticus]|nr:hypothetical protein LTR10_005353 [Elasticomyces elasticus]KAK4976090.1 hypothetical protein LTR42_003715 [Elasticomyces elasticus]
MLTLRHLPILAFLTAFAAAESAHMILCVDFDGQGPCKQFDIPSDAFGGSNGFSGGQSLKIDPNAICNAVGSCPSSVTIMADDDVSCVFGTSAGTFSCGGTTMELFAQDGRANFPQGLNDNLQCMSCKKDLI